MRTPATPARPDYTGRPGEPIMVFRDADGAFDVGSGRVSIASDDILFVNDVVADISRVVHSPEGQVVLRDGDSMGQRLRIVKPQPPTDPPNGWIVPDDIAAATARGVAAGRSDAGGAQIGTGEGCGSTIVYDPADWPRHGDPQSPDSTAILLLLLRQANANAAGKSNPLAADWGAAAASGAR